MRFPHKQSFPHLFHRFDVRHLGALPSLSINRLMGFASSAMIGVYFGIFLYEYFGFRIWPVLVWYIVSYSLRIPFLVIGAKIFSKIGLVTSMFIGTFFWMLFYFSAFLLDFQPDFWPLTILFIAAFSLSIFVGLYWSPFHVDFAKFSTSGRRGKQLSILYAIQRLLGVTAPIIGGLIITYFSFNAAFAVGIAIIALSLIPLAFLPKTKVQYEFGFFETFKKLFSKKYRYLTISMAAYGADSFVGATIWPIFLFIIFAGDYLNVGIFSSVIIILSILFQLYIGRLLDRKKPGKILKIGVDFYAFGWFMKALVDTVGGVFLASSFHSIGSIMMSTPVDMMSYDRAADAGHYVDEFTIMRELGLTIGRLSMAAVLIVVTWYFSISSAFIIAAFVSFGITLLTRLKVES